MQFTNARAFLPPPLQVLCTDFFKAAPLLFAEAIFVSPPWGGPKYKWWVAASVLCGGGGAGGLRALLSLWPTPTQGLSIAHLHHPQPPKTTP